MALWFYTVLKKELNWCKVKHFWQFASNYWSTYQIIQIWIRREERFFRPYLKLRKQNKTNNGDRIGISI